MSFTPEAPPVIVTVYVVDGVNAALGVNVTWFDDVLTLALTRLPPVLNWNVVPVTVDPFIASLKFAVTFVPILIPVDPFVGDTDVTVGGVLSTDAVVKLQL